MLWTIIVDNSSLMLDMDYEPSREHSIPKSLPHLFRPSHFPISLSRLISLVMSLRLKDLKEVQEYGW